MNTPILLLAFNRPVLAQKIVDILSTIKPEIIYIAIDGPRYNRSTDIDLINETISVFEKINWTNNIKWLIRKKNLGCGKAISTALDWFFENENMGIIIEDDCLPNYDFFVFCESMLKKYEHNEQVFAINGSNPILSSDVVSSYTYSKYNFVWGWATWSRAWEKYRYDIENEKDIQILINLFLQFKLDFISIRSWFKHLKLVANKRIDTWDYQWMYTCWKYRAKIITPRVNLVKNVGNDFEATHGHVYSEYLYLEQLELKPPFIPPYKFEINYKVDSLIKKIRFGNTLVQFIKAKFNVK